MTPKPQLLALLLQRLRRPRGAAHRRFQMMNLAALDPMPLGPGWFDSSWELENGLEVREASSVEVQLVREFEPAKFEPAKCEPAKCEPAIASSSRPARVAQNLIEFELADLGSWPLPAQRKPAAPRAELELALA